MVERMCGKVTFLAWHDEMIWAERGKFAEKLYET